MSKRMEMGRRRREKEAIFDLVIAGKWNGMENFLGFCFCRLESSYVFWFKMERERESFGSKWRETECVCVCVLNTRSVCTVFFFVTLCFMCFV